MKHFYQNIGEDWFTYSTFYSTVVENAENNAHFVEVGSWKGRSSVFMAVEIINSKKNIKFDCVDIWESSDEYLQYDSIVNNTLYEEFLENIKPVSNIINPIKKTSIEASKLYKDNSLDFVFIDACHSYECVKEDIINWYPKVKTGGIIAGHDLHVDEIMKAVNEELTEVYCVPREDIWIKSVN